MSPALRLDDVKPAPVKGVDRFGNAVAHRRSSLFVAQLVAEPGIDENAAGLIGPITISLGTRTQDGGLRFVHNMEENFPEPDAVTVEMADAEPEPSPVPAPAGALLAGLGGLLLGARKYRARR